MAVNVVIGWWWRVVFWYKKRTGWLDLQRTITVTGVVIEVDMPGMDGDGNFDVALDPGQDWAITALGGRLTCCPPVDQPSIHCEVEPWASDTLVATFRTLKVGQRVRVTGNHGFDGVHVGTYPEWIQVILALVRHQPSMADGWMEIHPVEKLEILQ